MLWDRDCREGSERRTSGDPDEAKVADRFRFEGVEHERDQLVPFGVVNVKYSRSLLPPLLPAPTVVKTTWLFTPSRKSWVGFR